MKATPKIATLIRSKNITVRDRAIYLLATGRPALGRYCGQFAQELGLGKVSRGARVASRIAGL